MTNVIFSPPRPRDADLPLLASATEIIDYRKIFGLSRSRREKHRDIPVEEKSNLD